MNILLIIIIIIIIIFFLTGLLFFFKKKTVQNVKCDKEMEELIIDSPIEERQFYELDDNEMEPQLISSMLKSLENITPRKEIMSIEGKNSEETTNKNDLNNELKNIMKQYDDFVIEEQNTKRVKFFDEENKELEEEEEVKEETEENKINKITNFFQENNLDENFFDKLDDVTCDKINDLIKNFRKFVIKKKRNEKKKKINI